MVYTACTAYNAYIDFSAFTAYIVYTTFALLLLLKHCIYSFINFWTFKQVFFSLIKLNFSLQQTTVSFEEKNTSLVNPPPDLQCSVFKIVSTVFHSCDCNQLRQKMIIAFGYKSWI